MEFSLYFCMYAQQLHGFERICVNPIFALSKKFDMVFVGEVDGFGG